MKQVLIIPDREHIQECIKLAECYGLGFEYNDFFLPEVLDEEAKLQEIVEQYEACYLPAYTTVHGAFLDVIPFSPDSRIREIAKLRIEQSIAVAERMGSRGVVFHANYNPFLNTESYKSTWIDTNIAFWSGVLEKYPKINIYLENMFDTHPDMLEKLSEGLCHYDNYGVCLDYAHLTLSKVAPETWAEKLGKYVRHIHINDHDGVSDLHMAWGDGCVDRKLFYACYEKYMNEATVLIETNSLENKVRSLEVLRQDGFWME